MGGRGGLEGSSPEGVRSVGPQYAPLPLRPVHRRASLRVRGDTPVLALAVECGVGVLWEIACCRARAE